MTEKMGKDEQKKSQQMKWWTFDVTETLDRLGSSKNGLEDKKANKKLEKVGKNSLPDKESKGAIEILGAQIKSTMVVVLLVAVVISFVLGDSIDAGIIFLAVVINVIVGFWQEYRTNKALAALKSIVVNFAKVIREGLEKEIKTTNLVPGDVVVLEPGDKIPADIRLFETNNLKINEAILTGESSPRKKTTKVLDEKIVLAERENMAYMGTIVTQGNGKGVVVGTAIDTAVGRIAELVAGVQDEKTPLQQKLDKFAIFLTKIILAVVFVVFLVGIFLGHDFKEMFVTAVALSVSAIPEGLLVVVTMILTVGMQRILKNKALVRQLLATETLGSTSVICADKTGTLTEGKMQIVTVLTHDSEFDLRKKDEEFTPEELEERMFLLSCGALCNNASLTTSDKGDIELVGNLTEKALLLAAHNIGLDKHSLENKQKRIDEVPFDSRYKFMMTLHEYDDNHNIIYLKGAPEKVLVFSDYVYSHNVKEPVEMRPDIRQKFDKAYEGLSKKGLRVLALGYKLTDKKIKHISDNAVVEDENEKEDIRSKYTNFVLVGLVGIQDPVRAGVKETLEITRKAGISTVMITGDNKFTAKEIAREVGLDIKPENIMEGQQLEKMSESELTTIVKNIKVYSRVTPQDKLKIVHAWQEQGKVVAMTGDGVNDSPALKKADIGIALGSGTDVAKEVADLVLLDNNFKVIVSAVKEGRIIFGNVKKVILYFLSDSFTEVFIITASIIMGWPLPIIASQIIWVNLIDDTFPALALSKDPSATDVMKEKPIAKKANILGKESKILIGLISLSTAALIMATFYFFWLGIEANYQLANTISFAILGLDTLLYMFSIRDLSRPVWRSKVFSNKLLLLSFIFGVVLQYIAIESPVLQNIFGTISLGFSNWMLVVLLALINVLIIELIKLIFNKFHVTDN